MTDFRINDYELLQEAKRLAQECFDDGDQGYDDPNECLWQACEGHEWSIYTYKALLLCAECDTSDGEEFLEGLGDNEWQDLSDHACTVAFATLYIAAMDALEELQQEEARRAI